MGLLLGGMALAAPLVLPAVVVTGVVLMGTVSLTVGVWVIG